MNTLTLEILRTLKKELSQSDPLPVGYVCSPAYFALVQSLATQARESVITQNGLPSVCDGLSGITLFQDMHQSEACRIFYDRVLLRAYLYRNEYPEAYIDASIRLQRGEPDLERAKAWLEMTGTLPKEGFE